MMKLKFFLRFDKEEKWLEHMASQGWLLSKKAVFYFFDRLNQKQRQLELIIGK